MGVLGDLAVGIFGGIIVVFLTNLLAARFDYRHPRRDHSKSPELIPIYPAGRLVDDRFELCDYLGQGRLSELWKARDRQRDDFVVVRLLLDRHIGDDSLIQQFIAASNAMKVLWDGGVPPIRVLAGKTANPVTYYYVSEFLVGNPLSIYREERGNAASRLADIDGIIQIAECLDKAHQRGIIHGSITPDDILIHGNNWSLVDFDIAGKFSQQNDAARISGMLSFSPPEVFGWESIDARTDIYNLARLLLFIYRDGTLPTPFEMTNSELIDWVNCGLPLKLVLRKATCNSPDQRQTTLVEFIDDLKRVKVPESSRAQIVGFVFQEREKIFRVLTQSILGTLAVMLPIRSIVVFFAMTLQAKFGWVQLSDRPIVGAFHGIIGSVVWGGLIPLGFILVWPLHVKVKHWTPVLTAVVCGFCGWLGGVLCSYMSVLVTSLAILNRLGWILDNARETSAERLHQTIHITHMFWAYPLEGMLTGIGVGIFLSIQMKALAKRNVPGLEPLPSKVYRRRPGCMVASLGFVLRHPFMQPILMLPILLAPLAALRLHANHVPFQNEWHRTLGEGFVQFVGAVGLVTGFFYGIIEPKSGGRRISRWKSSLVRIHKRLSNLSGKDAG